MLFKHPPPSLPTSSKYHQLKEENDEVKEELDYHYHHKIYRTTTRHFRYQPIKHGFQYPLFYLGVEVDKLNEGGGSLRVKRRRKRITKKKKSKEEEKEEKEEEEDYEEESEEYEKLEVGGWLGWLDNLMWGYNQWAWYSLWDDDYLMNEDDNKGRKLSLSLREKLELVMERELGIIPKFNRIELVTTPRVLGYSFNPVSFYFCYLPDDQLHLVIYEVHNTFGERHCYFLHPNTEEDNGQGIKFPRQFHVSPFNDRTGHYVTQLQDPNLANQLYIKLTIHKENETTFMAEVYGSSEPATITTLLNCFLTYPITALLTFPRIIYQAYLLHYVKLLPVYHRPPPLDTSLLFLPPSKLETYYFEIFKSWLSRVGKWNEVKIIIHRPGEGGLAAGEGDRNVREKFQGRIQLYLHSYDLVTELAYHLRDNNFLPIWSETYMRGGWSTDHLTPLLTSLLRHSSSLTSHPPPPSSDPLTNWILKGCQLTRSLFNSGRWRQGSELSKPYVTKFRTQVQDLLTRENDSPSKVPLPHCHLLDQPSHLHPNTDKVNPYHLLLALPLHYPYPSPPSTPSSTPYHHPFDHYPSLTLSTPWYHPLLHWLILLLGLTITHLDHYLSTKFATFHPNGDPTKVTRRHHELLLTIVNDDTAANGDDDPITTTASTPTDPYLIPYGYRHRPSHSTSHHPTPLIHHQSITTPLSPRQMVVEEKVDSDEIIRVRHFIHALQGATLKL